MSELFLGGVPTEPDVKLLEERWPELKAGDELTYDEIAEALGVTARGTRYRTVVTAWRKYLFSRKNLVLKAVPGYGLRVMLALERVDHSIKQTQQAQRKWKKATVVVSTTDRTGMTDAERKRVDRTETLMLGQLTSMATVQRQLANIKNAPGPRKLNHK